MKNRLVRFIILSAIGFILGGGMALLQGPNKAPVTSTSSPVAGVHVGGAFSLVDHRGRPVTEKSWPQRSAADKNSGAGTAPGKYKLVFFGFTHCPDTCPVTLQKIASVMEHFDPKGEKVVPLFVTVDPARDTPKAMSRYVRGFSPVIVGLTGTEAQIKAAEDTYRVYAAKQPGKAPEEYDEDHSAYIYLMAPDDTLLQTFSVDETAEKIISGLKESVK